MNTDDRAADVVRAHELLKFIGGDRAELRDLLRRWIGGLSPEAADAALRSTFATRCCWSTAVSES